jgi:hypothetical protein
VIDTGGGARKRVYEPDPWSDPDLMQQIRQNEAAVAEGDVVSLDDLRGRLGSDPQT